MPVLVCITKQKLHFVDISFESANAQMGKITEAHPKVVGSTTIFKSFSYFVFHKEFIENIKKINIDGSK